MNDAIDKSIKTLVESITEKMDSPDALRITQAALNLAHVKAVLSEIKD